MSAIMQSLFTMFLDVWNSYDTPGNPSNDSERVRQDFNRDYNRSYNFSEDSPQNRFLQTNLTQSQEQIWKAQDELNRLYQQMQELESRIKASRGNRQQVTMLRRRLESLKINCNSLENAQSMLQNFCSRTLQDAVNIERETILHVSKPGYNMS